MLITISPISIKEKRLLNLRSRKVARNYSFFQDAVFRYWYCNKNINKSSTLLNKWTILTYVGKIIKSKTLVVIHYNKYIIYKYNKYIINKW
jgi:hypothetical protein